MKQRSQELISPKRISGTVTSRSARAGEGPGDARGLLELDVRIRTNAGDCNDRVREKLAAGMSHRLRSGRVKWLCGGCRQALAQHASERSNGGIIQSETKLKDAEASPTTTLVSTRGISVTARAGRGIQFRRS
jgi:hypothetical protein